MTPKKPAAGQKPGAAACAAETSREGRSGSGIENWDDFVVTPRTKGDGWLRTDEFEDVRTSLLLLRDAIVQIESKPAYWKWAILAAHSALQGACVCLLTRTDGTGALKEKANKNLKNKLYKETDAGPNIDNHDMDWPEDQIHDLPNLLSRLPAGMSVVLPGRSAESYGYELAGDLRRLHEFRNQFTHFSSKGWSLEIRALPRILRCSVDLTHKIVFSEAYVRFNVFSEMELQPLFDELFMEIDKVSSRLFPT